MLVRRYRPLVTLNPFSEEDLLTLRKEFNRLWEEPCENGVSSNSWSIPLELSETPEGYHLRALLPGVDPSQINLEATPEEIVLSVELKPLTPNENSDSGEQTPTPSVHLQEFRYGKFIRKVNFGQSINPEQISANAQHGVLSLTIPKVETRKTSVKINVQ